MIIRVAIVGSALLLSAGGVCVLASATGSATAGYTAEQAARGKVAYAANCTDCHGANLNDGEFGGPPLKGEAFREKWFAQPMGELVEFERANMPPDSPGRLPLETYVDITAYLLSANGIAPGAQPLPADDNVLKVMHIPTPSESISKK